MKSAPSSVRSFHSLTSVVGPLAPPALADEERLKKPTARGTHKTLTG